MRDAFGHIGVARFYLDAAIRRKFRPEVIKRRRDELKQLEQQERDWWNSLMAMADSK